VSRDDFSYGGKTYSLGHLAPFTMQVTGKAPGARTFNVLVTFGCHTFTEKFEPNHSHELRYVEDNEERCFCEVRHGYSLHLPRIVRYAAGGRVFFSEGRNLLCIDWLPGVAAPYAVFFNMTKWRGKGLDAVMNVVSAYDKEALPEQLPAITFAALVGTVCSGQKVIIPNDKRSIKK